MKIAVISDIHGNIPALETVTADIEQWQPDCVVVDGDIVNRGPRSREALEWVLARHESDAWQLVRGNHEDYILECAAANGRIASTTSGPNEILGTKRPSMMSTCSQSAPPAIASDTCSPRRVKSAARMEGAIFTGSIR